MSSSDETELYPNLVEASDGRGHVIAAGVTATALQTDDVVVPGDTVTFHLVASHPAGKPVEWLANHVNSSAPPVKIPGADAHYEWVVSEDDVQENGGIFFQLRAPESRYHRFGDHDAQIEFWYSVRPPADWAP